MKPTDLFHSLNETELARIFLRRNLVGQVSSDLNLGSTSFNTPSIYQDPYASILAIHSFVQNILDKNVCATSLLFTAAFKEHKGRTEEVLMFDFTDMKTTELSLIKQFLDVNGKLSDQQLNEYLSKVQPNERKFILLPFESIKSEALDNIVLTGKVGLPFPVAINFVVTYQGEEYLFIPSFSLANQSLLIKSGENAFQLEPYLLEVNDEKLLELTKQRKRPAFMGVAGFLEGEEIIDGIYDSLITKFLHDFLHAVKTGFYTPETCETFINFAHYLIENFDKIIPLRFESESQRETYTRIFSRLYDFDAAIGRFSLEQGTNVLTIEQTLQSLIFFEERPDSFYLIPMFLIYALYNDSDNVRKVIGDKAYEELKAVAEPFESNVNDMLSRFVESLS